jgi:hypothetical protein
MSRTRTVCRSGLAVGAAVVLLTACGGSNNTSAGSSTTASRSSAAQSTASGAGSEFCTQAAGALKDVQPAVTGGSDPSALASALQDAANRVRTIHAPSAIAKDWTALGDGIEQFAQAFAGVNPNDPAAAASLNQRTSQIAANLTAAATKVQTYLTNQCGIAVPTGATPTS